MISSTHIKPYHKRYQKDGHVHFNKKFVPITPKRVELELLFKEDHYVCR